MANVPRPPCCWATIREARDVRPRILVSRTVPGALDLVLAYSCRAFAWPRLPPFRLSTGVALSLGCFIAPEGNLTEETAAAVDGCTVEGTGADPLTKN
jgi:hypothetical protein